MPFTSSVNAAAPAGFATPLLAVLVPQGGMPASLAALDRQTGGAIERLYGTGDFTGKKEEQALVHPIGPAPPSSP